MKYLKFISIVTFSLFLISSYQESSGKTIRQDKDKKIKTLCHPTRKIPSFDKPVLENIFYADNNTLKNAGEFDNPYLDKVIIRGMIKDKNCIPIPNASIKIWQEDEYGKKRYHKFSYSFTDRYELNQEQYSTFLGIAAASSDNNGYFTFVTVVPRIKMKKSNKQSPINIAVSHKDFPELENQIILNPKFPIKRSNERVLAFRNMEAQKFYNLPIYDFEIILNGSNKYKTF